jgi:hypothetical protein
MIVSMRNAQVPNARMRTSIAAGSSLGGSCQNDKRMYVPDVERHAHKQDAVIDKLRSVPLHRAKTRAHGTSSLAGGGVSASGGGRNTSAIAKPSPIAKARMGHSAR